MTTTQCIYRTHNALVTVVKQNGILLIFNLRKLLFQLFMVITIATHHAGPHWQCQSKFLCCFCIHFTYFRMTRQTKIIIETPYNHFLAAKFHTAVYFTLQFWKSKITMRSVTMLSDRTVMFYQTFKNICHNYL